MRCSYRVDGCVGKQDGSIYVEGQTFCPFLSVVVKSEVRKHKTESSVEPKDFSL